MSKAQGSTEPRLKVWHLLRGLFDRAVEVSDPMHFIARNLPPRPAGRVVVVGGGKASARMAEAVEHEWGPCEGLVITRHAHARPLRGIKVVEAAHPVPDAAGMCATQRIMGIMRALGPEDLALVLISGGASALLCAPAEGLSLADKQQVTAALLRSGATIGQINLVRKHLSAVKGGRLAAMAAPAAVHALMISDVAGDDPGMIGSGPTVGDGSTPAEALAVLAQYGITPPEPVVRALSLGSGVVAPVDPALARVENRVVAAPSHALAAAEQQARALGLHVTALGADLVGEAREVAAQHADLARELRARLRPGDPPQLILSGGELTVTCTGSGVGGPNAEYALALAISLEGALGIYALSCDTDGVDGAAEVAGAYVAPDTLPRAAALGLDARAALANNDAHSFFAALSDQVITGPTLTNVNDFRAILIEAPR